MKGELTKEQKATLTALDAAVVRLEDALEAKAASEHLLKALVVQSRMLGVSWAAIGKKLGVSKQAAWERFGDDERLGVERHVPPVGQYASMRATIKRDKGI